MDKFLKYGKWALLPVALVLIALAAPVFGADAWGRTLLKIGVPLDWSWSAVKWLGLLCVCVVVGLVLRGVKRVMVGAFGATDRKVFGRPVLRATPVDVLQAVKNKPRD